MASVYKKFTAQDFATIPFNAHKQYNFDSGSASGNSINHYNSRYTSESIDIYSTHPLSASTDTINTIKYNQIDHLYYDKFRINPSRTFEESNYLTHYRTLYEKMNILTMPNGLSGYEVKPGSFYLSSSKYQVVDDSNGNLIIQGSNVDNFPIDKRQNLFKLEPTNGFKAYDLKVFDGYAVFRYDEETEDKVYTKKFWRRGTINPNALNTYSTPFGMFDLDDSYHFNNIRYNVVQFGTSSLGSSDHKFPATLFDSITGSYIMSPHNELINFNNDEDFSISFWIETKACMAGGKIVLGMPLAGGTVFAKDSNHAYIASPVQLDGEPEDIGSPKSWGPNISTGASTTGLGGGRTNTALIQNTTGFNVGNSFFKDLPAPNGFTDWWVGNETEVQTIIETLLPKNPNLLDTLKVQNSFKEFNKVNIMTSEEDGISQFKLKTVSFDNSASSSFNYTENNVLQEASSENINTNRSINSSDPFPYGYFLVRRVEIDNISSQIGPALAALEKRYIICKSTTKTVVPKAQEGKSAIFSTKKDGNMKTLDTQAEPQFPFEIYIQSQSIHFDRSDGDKTVSISGLITGSNNTVVNNTSHILCQQTGSLMEIYFNGNKITSGSTNGLSQTRNTANIYIGSKGRQSVPDSKSNSNLRLFNGNLTNLNIWNKALTQTEITNVSESINASPYIGNIFYRNSFATITHPKYHTILSSSAVEGNLKQLKFKGTHLIYEHEYQCTVNENEYNNTYNITSRKEKSNTSNEIANFATGSNFKPFVTTIGLYNENNELLVVGKLGQPIRMSDETDTTFIVRWDT